MKTWVCDKCGHSCSLDIAVEENFVCSNCDGLLFEEGTNNKEKTNEA